MVASSNKGALKTRTDLLGSGSLRYMGTRITPWSSRATLLLGFSFSNEHKKQLSKLGLTPVWRREKQKQSHERHTTERTKHLSFQDGVGNISGSSFKGIVPHGEKPVRQLALACRSEVPCKLQEAALDT